MANERIADRPPQRPAGSDTREPQHDANHVKPRVRTRTRLTNTLPTTHDSYINFANIPDDTSLEWKLFSCAGQEYPFHLQAMRKQGWEPVNPQEHPDWLNLPPNFKDSTVVIDGLILVERPKSLTDQAREDDRMASKQRMREAEQRLGFTPRDTLTRDHEGAKPRIDKQYMRPMQVEE